MSAQAWAVTVTCILQLVGVGYIYGRLISKVEYLVNGGQERDNRIKSLENHREQHNRRLFHLELKPHAK